MLMRDHVSFLLFDYYLDEINVTDVRILHLIAILQRSLQLPEYHSTSNSGLTCYLIRTQACVLYIFITAQGLYFQGFTPFLHVSLIYFEISWSYSIFRSFLIISFSRSFLINLFMQDLMISWLLSFSGCKSFLISSSSGCRSFLVIFLFRIIKFPGLASFPGLKSLLIVFLFTI